MSLQVVTLEPLVQGEHSVATLRLLGQTEHAHQTTEHHILSCMKYRLRGLSPFTNISEKFIQRLLSNFMAPIV